MIAVEYAQVIEDFFFLIKPINLCFRKYIMLPSLLIAKNISCYFNFLSGGVLGVKT